MTATTGNTLALLQSVQALILANTGSAFAALSAADAARYGVSRAVFVGAPKEYKDGYLPQCHIIPEADLVAVSGGASRVEDVVTCRCGWSWIFRTGGRRSRLFWRFGISCWRCLRRMCVVEPLPAVRWWRWTWTRSSGVGSFRRCRWRVCGIAAGRY